LEVGALVYQVVKGVFLSAEFAHGWITYWGEVVPLALDKYRIVT